MENYPRQGHPPHSCGNQGKRKITSTLPNSLQGKDNIGQMVNTKLG